MPALPDPGETLATQSRQRPARSVRVLAALALLTVAGTYLAAQIDFFRRHHLHQTPQAYWLPQLKMIWAPGLGAALLLGATAFLLHRRARDK